MKLFGWLQSWIDRLFGKPVEGDREQMLKEYNDLKERAEKWERN